MVVPHHMVWDHTTQKEWRPVLFNGSNGYGKWQIYGLNKRKVSVKDIYEGDFGEIEVINPL